MAPVFSNGSRGTLMSYTDHSMQHRLKSNYSHVSRDRVLSQPMRLKNCVFSYRDIIANAINRSALI